MSARELRRRNERRCRRILEKSELLDVDDLDWDHVGAHRLDAGVIDTLVYMRDVEGFTDTYVVGRAHKSTLADARRDFLAVWQAEEFGHSQAIAVPRCLRRGDGCRRRAAADYASPRRAPVRASSPRRRCCRHRRCRRTHDVGRANELLTINGYRLLADQCGDPMLAELLRRIATQESRHYSFYLLQAEWRRSVARPLHAAAAHGRLVDACRRRRRLQDSTSSNVWSRCSAARRGANASSTAWIDASLRSLDSGGSGSTAAQRRLRWPRRKSPAAAGGRVTVPRHAQS